MADNENEVTNISHHISRYRVKKFALNSKEFDDPINILSQAVKSIILIEDFDQFIQPVFQVNVVLPPLVINYINGHKQEVSFLLRFQREDYICSVNGSGEEYSENKNGTEDICNDTFIAFLTDNAKNENIGIYRSMVETIEQGTENDYIHQITHSLGILTDYTQEYTFYLWKESDIYNLRKPVNYVFHNTAVGDATAYIAADSGFENILMAPSDKLNPLFQLIIPPMAAMNVFNFIQNTYGLYTSDVLLYLGLNTTYIIDKSGKCKAYEDDENTKTVIKVGSTYTIDAIDNGVHLNPNKKETQLNTDISKVFVRSLSEMNNIINGNGNLFIDSRNNEITSTDIENIQRGISCINVTTDQEGSEFTKSRIENGIKELWMNIKIVDIDSYDINAFTPNKEFIITFTNPESYMYNGNFRLIKATHIFSRISQGDTMSVIGTFEFTKKENGAEEDYNKTNHSVFKTAQQTDNPPDKDLSERISKSSPAFKQSEINQIAEGKKPKPKETIPGVKNINGNIPEHNKIKPDDSIDVINDKLEAQRDFVRNIKENSSVYPVNDQPINQDLINKIDIENPIEEINKLKGSKAPIPLDEK